MSLPTFDVYYDSHELLLILLSLLLYIYILIYLRKGD